MGSESPTKYAISGLMAGIISRTCTAPLDRVKILRQVELLDPKYKYGNLLQSWIKIGREEGIRGYWRGNLTNCLKVGPAAALRFSSYEFYVKKLTSLTGPTAATSLAGAAAGLTAGALTYPLDVVRTRLVMPHNIHNSIGGTLQSIAHREGVTGLYKGGSLALLSVAPFTGINFTVYRTVKLFIQSHIQDPSVLWFSLCGAVSGATAMTVMFPADLLKRHVMMDHEGSHSTGWGRTQRNFKRIWKAEGIRGFYRGLLPSYVKVVPTVAITFFSYELMKRELTGSPNVL